MSTLTFHSAKQINYDRDGIDVIYYYRISGSDDLHEVHIVGSNNSWNMTTQEKCDYAQLLFTGALSYIKQYWAKFGELPPEDVEIYEKADFKVDLNQSTDWKEYTLNL